jgi:aminoglycoside phosphotransferase (APT) family kinase protein
MFSVEWTRAKGPPPKLNIQHSAFNIRTLSFPSPVGYAPAKMTPEELSSRLTAFIARESGATAVQIADLRRMPGGASREIWRLDVTLEEKSGSRTLPLVLRRDPPGRAAESNRREEFLLLQAARAEGVPVPIVYWLGDDNETLGAPFFLMERVEGETIARRLLRDDIYAPARAAMTAELAEAVARIHRIEPQKHRLDFLPRPAAGESPAASEVDRYEQVYRLLAPQQHPVIELAFRWLRQHIPPSGRLAVVHGDYRIGNVIFGPEGLRSVLDWELTHLGDPMEDLGWLCTRAWRFGSDDKPVGGIGMREDLFRAYERASGEKVEPTHVRFWEIFGNLKWGIICMQQARTHLDGRMHSVELASLGRRTSETEWELLELIEA